MQNISSNLTLFLKIFIPTLWIVFFGLFTIASLLTTEEISIVTNSTFRIGLLIFFTTGCTILYFTLIQLKRVDMDSEFMYVSNYFKTYRYSYPSIEQIKERDFLLFHTIHVYLKEPGKFGKKFVFVSRSNKLDRFLKHHPLVANQLVGALKRPKTEVRSPK